MSRSVDLEPYAGLLAKKPELASTLSHDLEHYHQPFADRLIELRGQIGTDKAPYIVGGAANQGAGKTTRGEIYQILFATEGFPMISLSIDDLYLDHAALCQLRESDPRFESRGVTHDFALIDSTLDSVMRMGDKPILMPGPYDKGAHNGAGDRYLWVNPQPGVELTARLTEEEIMLNGQLQKAPVLHLDRATFQDKPLTLTDDMGSLIPLEPGFFPESGHALRQFLFDNVGSAYDLNVSVRNVGGKEVVCFQARDQSGASVEHYAVYSELPPGWRVIKKKPAFIFLEGWMQGLRPAEDKSVFNKDLLKLPGFRDENDIDFARFINDQVLPKYLRYWDMVDFQTVLYNPNYPITFEWREQQEQRLRAEGRKAKSPAEVRRFVEYFFRSLHPTLFLDRLARDIEHTDQVTILADDRRILSVTTPDQVDQILAQGVFS